jgi:hypothetical protein
MKPAIALALAIVWTFAFLFTGAEVIRSAQPAFFILAFAPYPVLLGWAVLSAWESCR